MEDPKAHVALLIDFDGLARAGVATSAAELAIALRRYAAGVGRVALARGYADWSRRAEDARAVDAVQVAPVLCPAGPAGEDRGHVRLVVDALEALYAGGEPDAYVIATADTRLLPLVRALRGDGCDLLVVHPAAIPCDEMKAEADVTATVEDVLGGAVGPASTPRVPEDEEEEEVESQAPPPPVPPRSAYGAPRGFEGGRGPGRGFGPGGPPDGRGGRPDRGGYGDRTDRPSFGDRPPPRGAFGDRPPARPGFGDRAPRPGPVPPRGGTGSDFSKYDWTGFIHLIDELEHRLPFVGVRYLVNKVLGPRNCGLDDPRLKRDLINRAVDEGLVAMFEVGNVDDRRDPVTACKLDRKNPVVVGVLGGETATPTVRETHGGPPRDDGDDGVEPGAPDDTDAPDAPEAPEPDDAD